MEKKVSVLILVVLFLMLPLTGRLFCSTVKAESQTFVCPTEVRATPILFENGSFQLPGSTGQIPMADVPGWSTYPLNPADALDLKAFNIEIQQVNPSGVSGFATTQADGTLYAELNAFYLGRLYQVVETVPGSRLLWQFAHRARAFGDNISGWGEDVLTLIIRTSGTPELAPAASEEILTVSSNAKAWYYYRGTYTVPVGQTSTEFSYASVSSATGGAGAGNYLDDIKFQTGASLIAKKSISTTAEDDSLAYIGEIVTITVDITNWGETDASHCVFRDILSKGLNYIDGSAKIDGADAGALATFDSSTDELRINFGTGATSGTVNTNGGRLEGSRSMGTATTTGEGDTITLTFQAEVVGIIGDRVKTQASITYNDYEFESYNAGDFIQYSSVAGQMPDAGDETTYVNQFVIVYDLSYSAPDADGGTLPSIIACSSGTMVTISTDEPTRTGYAFDGWVSDISGDTNTYKTNETDTFTMPSDDVILTARWVGNTYSITLVDGAGIGGLGTVTATYNSTMPSVATPTMDGYLFSGYYTGPDGTGTQYYDADMSDMAIWDIAVDTTLYAYWIPIDYNVTYNCNGRDGGAVPYDSTVYHYRDMVTISTDEPTRTGYAFDGWVSDISGDTNTYKTNETDTFTMPSDDVILTARWVGNTYSITLVDGAGIGSLGTVTATYNSTMPSVATPTMDGYLFSGYYTGPDGTGTQYYDADMSDMAIWDIAVDTTLYAYWIPIDYNVTYNCNGRDGGAVPYDSTVYHYRDMVTISADEPTRTGYAFDGWVSDISGDTNTYKTNETDTFTMPPGNVMLTASWTAESQMLTYTKPDGTTVTEYHDTDEVFNLGNGTEFEKESYTFDGWMIDGVYYAPCAEFKMLPYGVTVEPIWTKNVQTIAYSANGGSGSAFAEQQAGVVIALYDGAGFTREGYVIDGWTIVGVVYMLGELYEMPSDNVSAYAIWEIDSDKDGVSDKDEIAVGTDPNDPDEIPLIGNISVAVLDAENAGIENIICVLNSSPEVSFSDENGNVTYSGVYLFPHTLTLRDENDTELARFDLDFAEGDTNSVTIGDSGISVYSTVAGNFQTIHIVVQQDGDSWDIIDASIEEKILPGTSQSGNDTNAVNISDDGEQSGEVGFFESDIFMLILMIIVLAVAVRLAISIVSDMSVLSWYKSKRKNNIGF